MKRAVFAAAAAAVVIGLAGPAGAFELVFDVTVEGVSDGSAFTPFTFQQTWSWDAAYTTSTGPLLGSPPSYRVGQRLTGNFPTATDSPLTDGLKASAYASGADQSAFQSHGFLDAFNFYDTSDQFLRSNALMDLTRAFQGSEIVDLGGNNESGDSNDIRAAGTYSNTLFFGSFGDDPQELPFLDQAGLSAILAGRTLGWNESYRTQFVTNFGLDVISTETLTYRGTARLVTAVGGVPEPQSWALMIVGFGAAGAMVRRRRLAFRPLA